MTILATLSFPAGEQSNFPRSYIHTFALQWTGDQTPVSLGNPFVYEEHTFGGYRVHVKFKDVFYTWSSNVYSLDFIIEDLWAELPVTHTPINAGTVVMGVGSNAVDGWGIATSFAPQLGAYTQHILPPPPANYWLQPPS